MPASNRLILALATFFIVICFVAFRNSFVIRPVGDIGRSQAPGTPESVDAAGNAPLAVPVAPLQPALVPAPAKASKGPTLPQPTVPSPWPKAEVIDQAYVFYWYEMDPNDIQPGTTKPAATGPPKSWKDFASEANSYSPVVAIYVAVYSLRKLGVKLKIILLSTNPEAADDAILKWLGVEVRVVPLLQAVCKKFDGIPERRWNNLGQFTKLTALDQTDLKALIYLDSDAVFVRSMDDDIAKFAASQKGMGVAPEVKAKSKCDNAGHQEWDYGQAYDTNRPQWYKCSEDDWNCGLMFFRPSAADYKASVAMTQDESLFYDRKCGVSRNKCILGEAPFLHILARSKLYNGKLFCMHPHTVCYASKMHLCDGKEMRMMHWQGHRKPWKDWLNSETRKPHVLAKTCGGGNPACIPAAEQSVLLWWRLHTELAEALTGTSKGELSQLSPTGIGKQLRFFD